MVKIQSFQNTKSKLLLFSWAEPNEGVPNYLQGLLEPSYDTHKHTGFWYVP